MSPLDTVTAGNKLIDVWGPAGAIIVLLVGGLIYLARAFIKSQELRIDDNQKLTGKAMDIAVGLNATFKDTQAVMSGLKDQLGESRKAAEKVAEGLDRMHDELKQLRGEIGLQTKAVERLERIERLIRDVRQQTHPDSEET